MIADIIDNNPIFPETKGMIEREEQNINFAQFMYLNPVRRHERIASIISKSKALNTQTNMFQQKLKNKFGERGPSNQSFNFIRRKQTSEQLQEKIEPGHTQFISSCMDRLKKERKRQERKKMYSIQDRLPPKKNQSASMYIFLPIVSKHSEDQGLSKEERKKIKSNIVTTIDLWEGRTAKMKKARTFSLDERGHKNSFEIQNSFEVKAQQVIQDIKNNRHKAKFQKSLDFCMAQETVYVDRGQPKEASQAKSSLKVDQKSQKKAYTSRIGAFTAKKLEPWASHHESNDSHLIPEYLGIESYHFT